MASEEKANQENKSPTESIRNITVYGNYNEKIEGDYNQYREAILQRPFINRSPYKGLKKFNARDKDLFFGREKLTKKLIAAVNQSNLVLALGASGSGKSSVVRAGVMPEIENSLETPFESCLFTPNRDPFVSFHRSLLDPTKDIFSESEVEFILEGNQNTFQKTANLLKSKHHQWLIFIDQFEELFSPWVKPETRLNLIQGIIQIAQDQHNSIKLILGMRSDFSVELSAYPQFAEIAEKQIKIVADMQPEELRQAIANPAAHHGIVFESGLVEQIIQDVRGQAGSLPLLQYTLDLLWQNGQLNDRTLHTNTYHQLGGVSGALQKHINQIYQGLTPKQQIATKQIFLRLVDIVGQEKSEAIKTTVSRRAYKSEFTEAQAETVKLLTDNNLLVSDDPDREGQSTVEIAHEALLTSWTELKNWITDARNTISLNNRLAEDAANWKKSKKINQEQANDELWSGSKLEKVIEARKDRTFEVLGGLSDDVNSFIDASVNWKNRKLRELRQRAWRLGIISSVSVVFASIASFLGISSLYSSQKAQLKEQGANIKVKLTVSNEIEYLLESISLIGENQNFNRTWFKSQMKLLPEVQSVLYTGVEEIRERSVFNDHQSSVNSVAFSPDGKYLVSGSDDETMKLWDVKTKSLIHTFNNHQSSVNSVAFSPDGKYLVSGSDDETMKLWAVKTKSLIHTFNNHQSSVNSVAFSPDGKYLVSGSGDKTVKLWAVNNQSLVYTFNDHQSSVNSVAFSPDGKYLVSGSFDKTVKLWDVKTKSLIHIFDSYENLINSMSFSSDNHYFVNNSISTVKLWDVKTKSLTHTFNGHQGLVHSVAFRPNSKYFVSGSDDNKVKLWDVKTKSLIHTFNGHKSSIYSVAFDFDGNYLVSGGHDRTLKLWDVENQSLIHTFDNHHSEVSSVAFSNDGKYIVSGSYDTKVRLWNVKTKSLIHTFNGHEERVSSIAFSNDGKHIVSGGHDQTLKLWDVENQSLIHTFNNHHSVVSSVAFSPDGKYIASGGFDRRVKLWDVETKSFLRIFYDHQDIVNSVGFSPNGQYLVSGSDDKTVKLWDVETKSLVHTFNSHEDSVLSVAFSNDGQYILSGSGNSIYSSNDKTVKLWNVKTKSLVHTFNGHEDSVLSVAFSNDDQYILSGSGDGTVKLWDVSSKSEIYTFNSHQSSVFSVAFSPDGNYLVSGSNDMTVKLWRGIDWQDWLAVGCERIRLHPALVSREIESAPDAAKTCLEYGDWTNPEKAEFLVKQGLAFATQEGNVKEANKKFNQAANLDPKKVNLSELSAEANQLAEQYMQSQNK